MSDYLVSQLLYCAAFSLATIWFLWRYRVTVSRPVITRTLQFRLFAVRDAAIRLVAEEKCDEDDADFQQLYKLVNLTAHAANVQAILGGRFISFKILREVPAPTDEEIDDLPRRSECIRNLWVTYIVTVFSVYLDGSSILRDTYRKTHIRRLISKLQPPEVDKFDRWTKSYDRVKTAGRALAPA